jgi:AAA15 family ATPase/GTPase
MIEKLIINNFKSIKKLEIEAKRVNIFIGEPNAGKSNILEALGLLSWCGHYRGELKEYVRFRYMHNLFFDNLVDEPINVNITKSGNIKVDASLVYELDEFRLTLTSIGDEKLPKRDQIARFDYSGKGSISGSGDSEYRFLKFYRFKTLEAYHGRDFSYLFPPSGSNLLNLATGNKKIRDAITDFLKTYDLTLNLRHPENTIEIQQQSGHIVFSYPYMMLSDTVQRLIFYVIAMESNSESTIVFEEPEVHAFPSYIKWLGERIGMDSSNQYFLTTHNPYLITAIMDKTPIEDLNVFVTYRRDFQTRVKGLKPDQIAEMRTWDPFFNLSQFIPEENG